jgi:hypothetical protein
MFSFWGKFDDSMPYLTTDTLFDDNTDRILLVLADACSLDDFAQVYVIV